MCVLNNPEPKVERLLSPRVITALVLLVMALGLFVRLYRIETESIWFDEVVSVEKLGAPNLGAYLSDVRKDDPPMSPFYFVMQYGWAQVFGEEPLRIRYLSVFLGALVIPMVYLTGSRMFGQYAGLLAALLTALSLPQVVYSQEARVYSLVNLLVVCSMYSMVRVSETGDRKWWMLNGGANILIAATHALSQAAYIPQGLFLLLFLRHQKRALVIWFLLTGGLVVAEALWLLSNLNATLSAAAYIERPGLLEFINAYVVLAGGRASNWNPAPYMLTKMSLAIPLAVLMCLLTLFLGARVFLAKAPNRQGISVSVLRKWYVLLMLWLFAPAIALFVVSYVLHPSFIFRYFVYCSLAFTLLAAGGVSLLPWKWARIAAACLLIALAMYQNAVMARPFRPGYQGAVAIINEVGEPDAPVVVLKYVNAKPFRFVSGYHPSRIHEVEGIREVHQYLLDLSSNHDSAWVVTWHWDPIDALEEWMSSQGFGFEAHETGGIPPVILHRVLFR